MSWLKPRRAGGGGTTFRGGSLPYAEPEPLDPALRDRHYAGVEEAPDEQGQKRRGGVILILDGVHDRHGEIEAEGDFEVRHPSCAIAVELFLPRAGLAVNIEFRRAREFRFHSQNGFEHSLGVAHGEL